MSGHKLQLSILNLSPLLAVSEKNLYVVKLHPPISWELNLKKKKKAS